MIYFLLNQWLLILRIVPSARAAKGNREGSFTISSGSPIATFSFIRVILEPASAFPVIVGVELFVIEEDVAKDEGASGAVVSIVIEIEEILMIYYLQSLLL